MMRGRRSATQRWAAVLLVASGVAFAAATAAADDPQQQTQGAQAPDAVWDPWEPMNRKVFWFNERLDQYALEPAAKAWSFVMPNVAQKGVRNFYENISFPMNFGNCLLQGKPFAAAEVFGRFLVNSTFGLAGFIDVASYAGAPKHEEDFGQTLGVWGIPAGPYLVLPLLGPANPRETVGLVGDTFSAVYPWFIPLWASIVSRVPDALNERARLLEDIAAEREAAFDFYVFVRNAYLESRENQIRDRKDKEDDEDDDDLYYPEVPEVE